VLQFVVRVYQGIEIAVQRCAFSRILRSLTEREGRLITRVAHTRLVARMFRRGVRWTNFNLTSPLPRLTGELDLSSRIWKAFAMRPPGAVRRTLFFFTLTFELPTGSIVVEGATVTLVAETWFVSWVGGRRVCWARPGSLTAIREGHVQLVPINGSLHVLGTCTVGPPEAISIISIMRTFYCFARPFKRICDPFVFVVTLVSLIASAGYVGGVF
jgi:hypothetical protein